MKLKQLIPLCLILLSLVVPALAQDSTPEATSAAAPAPAKITIRVPNIAPEGVEYDAAHQRFLISSFVDGKIRQVADDGTTSVFIDDPALHETGGIQIDAKRNRLLVTDTNADDTVFNDLKQPGRAGLGAYDLDSGKQLFYVDLAALTKDPRHFAADVTVDADGNAYVTDAFAPVIYKVDPEGHAQVLVSDARFSHAKFGLDGIDYDPAGYLLVAQYGTGKLYKVPLDDPSKMTEVTLSKPFSGQGLTIGADGTLYVVAVFDSNPFEVGIFNSGAQSILALSSTDDWATASVKASIDTTDVATTITLRDGIPYYINAYVDFPGWPLYDILRANLKPTAASH